MIKKKRLRGFSLVELLIVIAIIGVLSAVAYPSFVKQGLKSKRTDAKTALLDLATRQERFFSINNTYSSVGTDLGYASVFPVAIGSSGAVNYQLAVGAASTTAFTATATPQSGQTADACGTYQLASNGATSNINNSTATQSCW